MSLFDQLVNEALKTQGELSPLRVVVEKELLHHDILREMAEAGLLQNLTFMGGTLPQQGARQNKPPME